MVAYAVKLDFSITNNEPKYEDLGSSIVKVLRAKNIKVSGHSRREYGANEVVMIKYLKLVKAHMLHFEECLVEHVPREENDTTYVLSKFASSEIESYPRIIYFEVLGAPSIDE